MEKGAVKSLLAMDREKLVSRAVADIPQQELERLEEIGVESREILYALLSLLEAGAGEGSHYPRELVRETANRLSGSGMSMDIAAVLCRALAGSVCESLQNTGSRDGVSEIAMGLLRAQDVFFEAIFEAEGLRKERIERNQREVDRFPDTIAATLDPRTLTRLGMDMLKRLLDADVVAVMSLDASRRLIPFEGVAAVDSGGDAISSLKLTPEAASKIIDKKEPCLLQPGAKSDAGCGCLKAGDGEPFLLLPTVVRGRTSAVIGISRDKGRKGFNPEEIELADRFASRFAVALESAQMHAREQRKIRETLALLEITRAINSSLDLREVLDRAARMTVDLCGMVMCIVYLRDENGRHLIPAAFYGFVDEGPREKDEWAGFEERDLERDHMAALERGDPVTLRSGKAEVMLSHQVMVEHGIDTALLFPLKAKDRLTGIFGLFYSCRESHELEMEEIEVVRAIAAQAAMAIENASLYEDIERSYFSTVKALAKAIEVKDPYTHGHSERVTEYALMIADEMNMDEREKQKLKYAATLHDIGKIGIAGRVLNKPSSLTDEEYTHVKTHPLLGESIVEPVEFLQGPRPIILHHHEHFDGKGYPAGLRGENIPLCARILSVADAFEAMRSNRPYRRAMPLPGAVEELVRNAGTQFDPHIVEVFLGVIKRCGGDPIKR